MEDGQGVGAGGTERKGGLGFEDVQTAWLGSLDDALPSLDLHVKSKGS